MKPIVSVAYLYHPNNIIRYTIAILLFASCNVHRAKEPIAANGTLGDVVLPKKSAVSFTSSAGTVTATKKKIYLTFDDGPNKGTQPVLDIIKGEQTPATFFLVGQHAEGSREQRELMDSLRALSMVELCNHRYSHAHNKFDRYYARPDSVLADFDRARKLLQLESMTARTPGRNIWRIDSITGTDIQSSKAAADTLQKNGYRLVGWDMEWHFEPKTMLLTKSANELKTQIDSLFIKNKVKQTNHLILLAHDQAYRNPSNIEELQKLVRILKEDSSYTLDLIKNYPGITPSQ